MCSNLQSAQISGLCIWNVSKLPGIYLHLVPKLWRKMINRPAARQPINKPGIVEKQAASPSFLCVWHTVSSKWVRGMCLVYDDDVCMHFVHHVVYVHGVVCISLKECMGFVYMACV